MRYFKAFDRRSFIKTSALAGIGASLSSFSLLKDKSNLSLQAGKKIGIIGLDTSHSRVFSELINAGDGLNGYKVVAAFAEGTKDIPSALQEKPGIIEAVKAMGIELVPSIEALLEKVDVVLLESNDGRVHYEQALPVLRAGKRMFIDKPVAATFKDAKRIFEASRTHQTPIFTSSALRFDTNVQKVVSGSIGKVTGADVYTPATIEPNHMDMAWYGIHGVEMLFTVMGHGCKNVSRVYQEGTDLITGIWEDGRIGTVRGIRKGAANIAGTAFGESGIAPLGPFTSYEPLVKQIVNFFDTGIPPVSEKETTEIFSFIHAADISRRKNGATIALKNI